MSYFNTSKSRGLEPARRIKQRVLKRLSRKLFIVASMLLLCGIGTGCDNVEWHWDLAWWKKPRRVVRPTRPDNRPAQREPKEEDRPRTREPRREPPPDATAQPGSPATDRESPVGQRPDAPPPRPYYQFYLLSGPNPAQSERGERRLALKAAPAQRCAALLEMLYVPLGRSGSLDESYLLYEDAGDFEAAAVFAPLLDVAPQSSSVSAVGPEASFRAGVGLFMSILGEGAIVDRGWVDACERHLAAAAQAVQFPPLQRWAAGILAGRLVSDYRYDFESARSYYRQAERVVPAGSREKMTAKWWLADALVQEGKSNEAMTVYTSIVATYSKAWPQAQAVRRGKERLNELRRRQP